MGSGDGGPCFEVHTKLDTIDPDVLDQLAQAIETVPGRFRALILANEGERFSAGASLGLAFFAAHRPTFDPESRPALGSPPRRRRFFRSGTRWPLRDAARLPRPRP